MQRRSLTQKKWNHEPSNNITRRFVNTRYSFRKDEVPVNCSFSPKKIEEKKKELQLLSDKSRLRLRIVSEPSKEISPAKPDVMQKISKKISFIKKMVNSVQVEKKNKKVQDPAGLFQFQRFYEHCLKKLKRGINVYERDS